MTAIFSARAGLKVLLLDSQPKIGAKILMSGGTRCNVTNQKVTENDFHSENPRAVKNILQGFPSGQAVRFFEGLDVELVLEEGGKYFPSTHSGRTILEVLTKEIKRLGVTLEVSCKVRKIDFENQVFTVSGEGFEHVSKTVVLCTGGLSYPTTGSDGSGYSLAKSFGHSLIPTIPSLTPLETDDQDWKNLTGVSLPVRLTLWAGDKKQISYEGSFLFTHFGFSGPVVLNLSRHWIRSKENSTVKVAANFLPGITEERFREKLEVDTRWYPKESLKKFLTPTLPERFVEIFLRRQSVPENVILNQLTREQREKLIRALYHSPLSVTGAVGYKKAEATAGGVDFKGVNPKTLESKLQPGLFFAGEILDVDGRIGGFNFQWAWSSGVAAARAIAEKLGVKPPKSSEVSRD